MTKLLSPEEVALKRAAMAELWEIDPRLRSDPQAFGRACTRYWAAIKRINKRTAKGEYPPANCPELRAAIIAARDLDH